MKNYLFLSFFLSILILVSADWKIINGTKTVMNEYPQIVSLKMFNEHLCGGTLLNKNTVLTAAHCIYLFDNWSLKDLIENEVKVVLNEYDLESLSGKEKEFQVIKTILHHTYSDVASYLNGNDVGLIKFQGQVLNSETEYVKYITNNSSFTVDLKGRCEVVGWGSMLPSGEGNSRYLQKAYLNIISNEECSKDYDFVYSVKSNFCAGSGKQSTASCKGDSGGPLFCKNVYNQNVQVGIVSYGVEPCGQYGVPTVYTKISEVAEWITAKAKKD